MLARAALLFSIAAVGITANAQAPTNRAQASRGRTDSVAAATLATRVDSLRQALRIPGLALVVLRDTTVVLARGFGFADVDRRVPVTPATPFNIASVAKPISAVLALLLVERGLLDLDRPMRRYASFPEFCDNARTSGGAVRQARYSHTGWAGFSPISRTVASRGTRVSGKDSTRRAILKC